jgi:hypothetical protein
MMISLVIATMWKYEPFIDFLTHLCRVDIVQEIIIINNDAEKTPDAPILKHYKIQVHDFGKNIKVNPAWNFGASVAKSEIIGIMNDDLIYDLKLLQKVNDFMLSTPNMGAVGLSYNDPNIGQTPFKNGQVDFEQFIGQAAYGFGNLFFAPRDKWHPIPFGMDIWCGDVFVFEYFYFYGYANYMITNAFYCHNDNREGGSVTGTLDENTRNAISQQEIEIYAKIKEKLINKIPL